MNKYKILRNIFVVSTLILSHLLCYSVAFNYASMLCGVEHGGFSAPANTAFIIAIPHAVLVVVCLIMALVFHKKSQ